MSSEAPLSQSPKHFVVAALYHFADLPDPSATVSEIKKRCAGLDLLGTLLVGGEGINGTIAGSRSSIDAVLEYLRSIAGFAALEHKESYCDDAPFFRLKVKEKKEIVTMGVEGVRPADKVGTYVDPEEWNQLIQRDDVVVIDTRNDFEVRVGTFEGAINPKTESFSEFPEYVEKEFPKLGAFPVNDAESKETKEPKKVAMFCTGGIRCEKATSHLVEQGYEEIYHLKGGILRYLEVMPEERSLWKGECFVFDRRVSLVHGLGIGSYELCHGCQSPLSPEQREHADFHEGISCEYCADSLTPERKAALEMRREQMHRAAERGEAHLGMKKEELRAKRREKEARKERERERQKALQ